MKDDIALIFDIGGVLVDNRLYDWKSFRQTLKERHDIYLDKEGINEYIGLPLGDLLECWEDKYGIVIDYEAFDKRSAEIQFEMLENESADQKLVEFLDELWKHKVPMSVATSSKRWRAEKILKLLKIYDYFSVVKTVEDVGRGKPCPDIYLEVAEALDYPQNIVVIEDSSVGVNAAKRAAKKLRDDKSVNIYVVGFSRNDDRHREEIDLSRADEIIHDFSELSYDSIRELLS